MPETKPSRLPRTTDRYSRCTLSGLTLFLAIGCLASAQVSAATGCFKAGTPPDSLVLSAESVPAAGATLTIAEDHRQNLAIQNVSSLTGACWTDVLGFEMSQLFSGNALQAEVGRDGTLSAARARTPQTRFMAIDATDPHPRWEGGQFIMASRVDTRNTQQGHVDYFVGVWKEEDGAALGAFRRDETGAFTKPVLLLRSSLPIRSASYFPAPDSPAGIIGMAQEDKDRLRLININWYHPDLFKQ